MISTDKRKLMREKLQLNQEIQKQNRISEEEEKDGEQEKEDAFPENGSSGEQAKWLWLHSARRQNDEELLDSEIHRIAHSIFEAVGGKPGAYTGDPGAYTFFDVTPIYKAFELRWGVKRHTLTGHYVRLETAITSYHCVMFSSMSDATKKSLWNAVYAYLGIVYFLPEQLSFFKKSFVATGVEVECVYLKQYQTFVRPLAKEKELSEKENNAINAKLENVSDSFLHNSSGGSGGIDASSVMVGSGGGSDWVDAPDRSPAIVGTKKRPSIKKRIARLFKGE